MGTSRRSALRLLPPLALMVASLGVASLACYKPSIVDGKLKCNLDAGAAHACPEGFKCEASTQLCKMHPSNDAALEVMTDAGDGGEMTDAKDADATCFQATPTCASTPAGLCDPACQTGCACGKCSINTNGALTCNVPRMQGFPRGLMQDCTIESGGSGAQTDNCGPGLVCIEDGCYARCFQFCKSDGDCTNSTCTRDTVGPDGGATGQKVCDVPFVDSCIPLPSSQNMGCGNTSGTMSCYLSSTNPTHTICDCPLGASGSNGPCARSRECVRGLACVQLANQPQPICLQTCRLDLDGGNDCMLGQACHPYVGIPRGTQSNATFGYCL